MEAIINENVEAEPVEEGEFEKFKKHLAKHKKKYIVGGSLVLGFTLGFVLGKGGNSKRHYSKLLKDGVKDAVRDGVKDVVDAGMRDVVKDGMKSVVTDVVTNVVRNNVRDTVDGAVKNAIKETGITIIKEVTTVESSPIKIKDVDEIQKVINYITDDHNGLKIIYDTDSKTYTVK